MSFSRRTLLKASAASAVLGGISAPLVARAQTAEFTYKYANNLPDGHPMNARAKEMAAAIKAETNGRFDLQIFPNNQLGSDTDMLSQIRSGGVEFFTLSGLILATLKRRKRKRRRTLLLPCLTTLIKSLSMARPHIVQRPAKPSSRQILRQRAAR